VRIFLYVNLHALTLSYREDRQRSENTFVIHDHPASTDGTAGLEKVFSLL
jgi:hypothetical protein